MFKKYASTRHAGIFTSDSTAQMQVFIPNEMTDYGFGVYNQ